MRFCTGCGAPLKPQDTYCVECLTPCRAQPNDEDERSLTAPWDEGPENGEARDAETTDE